MAKRIILISSFPLLVAIAIITIVLAEIGQGQSAVGTAGQYAWDRKYDSARRL